MKTRQALLLKAIREIHCLERGSLCRIRQGPGGAYYYNHQSWEQGRNRVRYVPAAQVAALREAIGEHHRLMGLLQAYVEQVIGQTRRERAKEAGEAERKPSRPPTPGGKGATGRSRAREARRRTAPRAGGRA